MALDPSPDREPGMDARILTPNGIEYARSKNGSWESLGHTDRDPGLSGYSWQALATMNPDAVVVLP